MADITTPFPNNPANAEPIFSTVDFKTVTPTITSTTNSGKLRRVGMGTSYYSWTAKYNNLTDREVGPVLGFIRYCEGGLYSFEIKLPNISNTKTINQVTAAITQVAIPIGSVNVRISTTNTNSEVLRAGDYFKFNNHSKVYQAVINCNSNGTGNAILTFASPTVSNVASGTGLTIDNVPFTAVFDGQEQDYNVSYGGITTLEVKMREVW
jgi:hypothetical protein